MADVASGLKYLHNQERLHRDLTARNVLLTHTCEAKISDFGNSRVFDSTSSVQAMSSCRGTREYMPPEALGGASINYDSKLDVFSFGHLGLFTATQEFLEPLHYTHTVDGNTYARTEVQTREKYFDKLELDHPLTKLFAKCLHNDPKKRPTPDCILEVLSGMDRSQPPSLVREYQHYNSEASPIKLSVDIN